MNLSKLLLIGFCSIAVYLILAVGLTLLPNPRFEILNTAQTPTVTTVGSFDEQRFAARDGAELFARRIEGNGDTVILLIHGVAADGGQLAQSADMLRTATNATVYALDLRGHGQSGGKRGDVAYDGQYEADVADVVATLRERYPERQLLLAGHSMGGGVALRYAGILADAAVDGYLLFAPHLGQSSPTTPVADADAGEATKHFVRVHIPRIIGLTMLNRVGIRWLDGQETLFFNLPEGQTRSYSFRAMLNSSPADHAAVLRAVDAPLLVLIGTADEAFIADQYPAVIAQYTLGQVKVIQGETHTGIYTNKTAINAVANWLNDQAAR